MAATLEYIGLNSSALPTSLPGGTATLTFQAASSDCRGRWLFIDAWATGNEDAAPLAPALMGSFHVSSIRINGGPNLVTGLIPVGVFNSLCPATNGFPSGEMNLTLNAGDVVTVTIEDSNPGGPQVGTTWQGQLKVDSASSSSGTNTAASVIGKDTYWLGSATPITLAQPNLPAIWTSAPAPSEMYLDYQYLWSTTASSQPAVKGGLLLTSLIVSNAPGLDYVDGFASASPQDGTMSSSALDTGQQVRILVPAGATVTAVYLNVSGTNTFISLGWSVLSND